MADSGIRETAPFSMRFVKGFSAFLGCPKDYCSFEFIFTASTGYAQKMIDAYDIALREKFGNDVRMHWGQLMRDPKPEEIRGMYKNYDVWRKIRDTLDPEKTFLNEWQEGILPPLEP